MVRMLAMFQCIPRHYITAFLCFLSFVILNAQRMNISLALEVMTVSSAQTLSEHTGSGCAKPSSPRNATDIHARQGAYDWDSKTQGLILGSSFMGFVATQILGGILAETLGAKQILCFSLACASVCNLLSPLAASRSAELLIAAQTVRGMAQGLLQPAVTCLMARWYPKDKMSFLSSATYSGFPAGALIGGIVTGALCNTGFLGGWPSSFYVFGFAGVFLALVEVFLVYNFPGECKSSNSFDLETPTDAKDNNRNECMKTPWTKMILCVPTWALLAGMIGQYWMTFYFLSVHPAYLSDVLNLNIKQNGMFSSLPYILQMIVTWVSSFISDWLTEHNLASSNTVRKWCNSLSCLGFSLSMLGAIFAECNYSFNIICFFIAMASIGLGYPGSLTVPMDMTKNFAGTLVGLSGTIASTSGFIIPGIMGHIIQNEGNLTQWSEFISISIVVVMASGIVFHLFASSKLQDWDDSPIEETHTENKEQSKKIKTANSIK